MINDHLSLDAFIRAVGISRSTPHVLFLGAGASITSGMPSAQMCIWEWKRNIFLTNNVGLESQFSELSLTSVRQRIQQWLDRQGIYPLDGAPEEYSVYIEACYPIPDSRRSYFQEKVRNANPYIGYQLLGLLASQIPIKSVWTTNFDQLVSRAVASSGVMPIEVGIDSANRVIRPSKTGELLIVSLHGDYRYDQLKNTATEIKHQESNLELGFIEELKNSSVIVLGYSGRDESIMRAFARSLEQKGTGVLYWCVQDTDNVPEEVLNLISYARSHDRTAYVVPTQGFDDVMIRLALHCLDTVGRASATQIINKNNDGSDISIRPFRIDSAPPTAILKSNAFEIECPPEVLAFELKQWPEKQIWKWMRAQTADRNVVAVPFKNQVFAFGTIEDISACFGENIKDRPIRVPISEGNLRIEDGSISFLLRNALLRSMATATGMQTDSMHELWSIESPRDEQVDGESFRVYQSVIISLRQIEKRSFLVLLPSLKVFNSSGEEVPRLNANLIKMRILGWQHNKEFNEAVNSWRAKLLSTDKPQKTYEYPTACSTPFKFLIRRSPTFAEVSGGKGAPAIAIESKFRPLIKQKGIQISEPELVFANRVGQGTVRDVHPVRGIMNNRPFDFPLTVQGFGEEIRLGIICPKLETKFLQQYLANLERQIQPSQHEADYLPQYPGFRSAFGVDIVVAEPGSSGWIISPEPAGSDARTNTIEIGTSITRSIEMLQASYSPNVVLIFFPERWSQYRSFNMELERFNVHDFVKASSVQRGIGTQFLDQSTLSEGMQCRVWWWLSLAFYVKAMRTPWVLGSLDRESAFVGLGMSYDPNQELNKKVVMGCSHIYSSRGEGLQYRLSRVENPVFFGKNPYLSRDDARRVGEQIRELFFESRSSLPRRVVIHKRTRFTNDEQKGLREGLGGVSQIEMIEILIDDTLRYVASAVDARGGLHEDKYPVRRGTTIRLDDFTALLWVHGVTSAISSSNKYYQGKRRIPAPLIIRRHAGQSDIKHLAEEILGLSKMNWNTFDLYTKLPATVQSSNEIARIGSLLGRFQPRSYDFRLFI